MLFGLGKRGRISVLGTNDLQVGFVIVLNSAGPIISENRSRRWVQSYIRASSKIIVLYAGGVT